MRERLRERESEIYIYIIYKELSGDKKRDAIAVISLPISSCYISLVND